MKHKSEDRVCRWAMCPMCSIVQPVLETDVDYGGLEIMDCRWCEHNCGAPFSVDVNEWIVPMTELTEGCVFEFVEKLRK